MTSVRIEGVAHEFSTIKGVSEDVTYFLNLKGIVCRMHSDATEVEAPLVVTVPGEITARDIDLPSGVEILNPDAHIATLEKKTKLELYLTIGRGRGYRPAEQVRPTSRSASSRSIRSSRRSSASLTRSSRPASASAPTSTSSRSTSRPTARSTPRPRCARPRRS